MSDFPRGWTLSTRSVGGTAFVTVPAVAGIVHVLDSFSTKIFNGSAAQAGFVLSLTSSDGVFSGFILAELEASTPNGVDSGSESGLDLAAGPGASLTIQFNGGAALVNQILVVQGHDI